MFQNEDLEILYSVELEYHIINEFALTNKIDAKFFQRKINEEKVKSRIKKMSEIYKYDIQVSYFFIYNLSEGMC
ncbi:hypothetical protein ACTFH7_05100 [Clostridium cagae]|uniref:hypothetical protein n=1 Tax=Clostridium cagae TaxID=2080751 RepID=UPI003F76E4E5